MGGSPLDSIFKPAVTMELLNENGLKPNQGLGQNFLIDGNILRKIVDAAELTGDDAVLEIGPGLGALTQALIEESSKVVTIEIDERLVQVLKNTFLGKSNLEIIHGDVLKEDLNALLATSQRWKVVANLPYYITSPILAKLLEEKESLERIVVMVQREVAQRMMAGPGTKDYGSFSLFIQYHCEVSIIHTVPPTAFFPRPQVSSSVVLLRIRESPRVQVEDEDMLFRIIRAAFGKRRKTLLNSLTNTPHLTFNKEFMLQVLKEAGIDSKARAETLSLEEFASIAHIVRNEGENSGVHKPDERSHEP